MPDCPHCPHCQNGRRQLVTFDGRIVVVQCGAGEHRPLEPEEEGGTLEDLL